MDRNKLHEIAEEIERVNDAIESIIQSSAHNHPQAETLRNRLKSLYKDYERVADFLRKMPGGLS